MAGDRSRTSFDPRRFFRAVRLQQGRAQVDKDANDLYASVRRLFAFIQQSINEGLQWAGFEPTRRRWWERLARRH